jgi:hypothetical protein
MANPTTNYGFVLPTATDLVTDLPADFDVALQGVDTRLKALQPGTTLGDLAYSSATANTNTRLGVGTTGQVLTVSSGVPAWATPATAASGLTLISSTTISNATSASINNCFSATYDNYLVAISLDAGGNGADYPYIRVRVGGTDLSSGTYAKQRITLNGATTSSAATTADTEVTSVMFSDNTAGTSSYCLATFINPFATKPTFLNYNTTSYNGTGTSNVFYATGIVKNTTSYDGFSLINGNTMNGRIRVYGYQNS